MSCGCCEPANDHGDARHISLLVLQGAADAAACSVQQAAMNIQRTTDLMGTGQLAVEKGLLDQVSDVAVGRVIKSESTDRFTLSVAYPALRKDGHNEFARSETVEKTAWRWMTKSRRIGLYHVRGLAGFGEAVESHVWRAPDWEITDVRGETQVVKAGDWLAGVQWSPEAWDLILTGRVNGMSIDGRARHRTVAAALR